MTSTTAAPGLPDSDLERMLGLMKGADSVELKLTVPNAAHRSTVGGLGLDPLDAQIRQVFFFDTPTLALNQAGLVVRARRVQGRDGDSAVKLRPVEPSELPSRLRKSPNLVVEVDAMPGGFVCSASLKSPLANAHAHDAVSGVRAVRKLFSKEQREFFAAHAPDGIALDELSVLGPIFVLKLNFNPKEFGRKMVGEMWLYPDGSRILELSTKCAPAEAFQVAAEAKAFLAKRGVDVGGEQQTKTKTALEFFSAELQAASS
jgi:hypothetical protein